MRQRLTTNNDPIGLNNSAQIKEKLKASDEHTHIPHNNQSKSATRSDRAYGRSFSQDVKIWILKPFYLHAVATFFLILALIILQPWQYAHTDYVPI